MNGLLWSLCSRSLRFSSNCTNLRKRLDFANDSPPTWSDSTPAPVYPVPKVNQLLQPLPSGPFASKKPRVLWKSETAVRGYARLRRDGHSRTRAIMNSGHLKNAGSSWNPDRIFERRISQFVSAERRARAEGDSSPITTKQVITSKFVCKFSCRRRGSAARIPPSETGRDSNELRPLPADSQ